MRLLNELRYAGFHYGKTAAERRSILISNGISLILFALGLFLFVTYYLWYGWSVITAAIPVISSLALLTLLLNARNFSRAARFYLCVLIPVATLALSIYSKNLYYQQQEELDYFTFRFIILASCVLPPVLFSFKELKVLVASGLTGFLLLTMHDPLHELFGVPYAHGILKVTNYTFTNVVVIVTYLLMVGAVIFMKWVSEKSEERANSLIHQLNHTNRELVDKNTEIELQNQEIIAQSENLNASQQKLTDAYKIIEEQRNLLFTQNKNLSTELVEKNKELTETNTELIKYNNELRQFSYTVSHNLRGPVASLIGLIKLFNKETLLEDEAEIFSHIEASTQRLESIIKDLGKIIDIRHDIFQIRQKIDLDTEINQIVDVLGKEIETYNVQVLQDLSRCPSMYSVKPMVHSILYNLISNAIKYRANRRPVVEISSDEDDNFYYLEVKDNGLGIDLENNMDNLFKLYKRFHHHTEGKGLGLYLVKLQAEALGGAIEVESELNQFSRFNVKLRKPEDAHRQVLYRKPYAEIFFDARLNSIGTIWNGPVTSENYRSVFRKCLEFVKAYNTPNYMADLTKEGPIAKVDQQWMFKEILPQASHSGLLRIAAVRPDASDENMREYFMTITETLEKLGIRQVYFSTLEEASSWIQKENQKNPVGIVVKES